MFGIKRGKPEGKSSTRAYSVVFADHLIDLGSDGFLYKSVKQAVDLCDSALRNVKDRVALSDKLHEYDKQLSGLAYILRMSDDEIQHFNSLLERFTSLSEERSGLLTRLARFDKALPVLENMEAQAGEAIFGMREAEEYFSALRHDISFLEGEKEDLRFEHNYLTTGVNFISKFGVGLTGLFLFAAVLLGYMNVIQGLDVLMYSVALVFLAITSGVLLYVFRKRISFELSLNNKKQKKAIHVLNQKNTVFAFYSNFLNYSYDKYHVRSASMLQSNLKDYKQYKQVAKRVDNVRGVMYQTQREIEEIMRDKKIDQDKATMEGFAKTLNLNDKKRTADALMAAKTETEKRLAELEKRHEATWELLTRLKEDRTNARERIEGVVQTYLDEVGKILNEGETA